MVRLLEHQVVVVVAAAVMVVDNHSEAAESLDWTEMKAWIWFVGGSEHDYSVVVAEEVDYCRDKAG